MNGEDALTKKNLPNTRLTHVALINYTWSQSPALLAEPVQKTIAALMIALMGISSVWYGKRGITSNAFATALIAALQSYSAFAA